MLKLKIILKENVNQKTPLHTQIVNGQAVNYFLEGNTMIRAYLGDQQIGYINFIKSDKASKNNKIVFKVKSIQVDANYRLKGVANNLYTLAIYQSKKMGATHFASDDRRSENSDPIWKKWQSDSEKGKYIEQEPISNAKIKNAIRYYINLANNGESAWILKNDDKPSSHQPTI